MITLSALLALVSSATAHLLTVINANPSAIGPIVSSEIAIAQSVPLFRSESPPIFSDQSDVQRIWNYRQILGDGDPLSRTVHSLPETTHGYVYMPTHQAVPPTTVVEWMPNQGRILNPSDHVYSDRPVHSPSASNRTVASYPVDLGTGCPSPLVGLQDLNKFPVWCSPVASTDTLQRPSYLVLDSDYTPTLGLPSAESGARSLILSVPSSLIPSGTFSPRFPATSCNTVTNSGSGMSVANIVSGVNTSNTNDIPNFTSPSGGTGMLAVLNTTAPWAALVPCVLVGWLLVR